MNAVKTLLILLGTYLCCINFSFALDLALVKENLLNKTKEISELNIETEDVVVENKMFNNQSYVFIIANISGYTDRTIVGTSFSCINILHSDKVIFAFCSNGYMQTQTKGDFWTLENKSKEFGYEESYRNESYYTFRLINDIFYLHQYSQKYFHYDRFCGRFDDRLISFDIFYRQPRDDPKKENLIPLDSINDEFFSKLTELCYKAGHCKEVDWEVVNERKLKDFSESCE